MIKLLTMLYIILNIVIVITEISDIFLEPCNDYLFFTPNHIYVNTKMNIIGCYITSIFSYMSYAIILSASKHYLSYILATSYW